jgi:hypothetical protein
MTGALLLLCVLSESPSDASPDVARTAQQLRDATNEALRRWARPSDYEARVAAQEFVRLYAELDGSNPLAASQKESLKAKVRGRLTELVKQVAKQAAIDRRLARGQPVSVELPESAALLAQMGGVGGGFGQAGFGQGGFGQGGAGFGGGMGQGGSVLGPADADHGEALVELIQKTISPSSWDVNGGLGSMYYWRPGRALVVRATDEVHGQVGDVLNQLQRAGQ